MPKKFKYISRCRVYCWSCLAVETARVKLNEVSLKCRYKSSNIHIIDLITCKCWLLENFIYPLNLILPQKILNAAAILSCLCSSCLVIYVLLHRKQDENRPQHLSTPKSRWINHEFVTSSHWWAATFGGLTAEN